jgi:hypothetical protein
MATSQHTGKAEERLSLLPRFVRNLNSLAERCGLTVTVEIDTYEGESEERLFTEWQGTKDQLVATGLLNPSYRFPAKRGSLSIPDTIRAP